MILTSENYAAKAEAVMKKLCNEKDIKGRDVEPVTTSKIRNLLSMTADIYNEAVNCKEDRLPVELIEQINYMKIRFVYEAGREPKVGKLVQEAQILNCIDEIGQQRKNYILFSRYMEALVAYRKFYGKRDE